MQRYEVLEQLKNYISSELLNGNYTDLDASTPLLEWGVIGSLELVMLLNLIHDKFNVQIPDKKILADHFKDMNSITELVLDLEKRQSAEMTGKESI